MRLIFIYLLVISAVTLAGQSRTVHATKGMHPITPPGGDTIIKGYYPPLAIRTRGRSKADTSFSNVMYADSLGIVRLAKNTMKVCTSKGWYTLPACSFPQLEKGYTFIAYIGN